MAKKVETTKDKEKDLKESTKDIEKLAETLGVELKNTAKELQENLSAKLDEQIEFKIERRLKEEEKRLAKRQTFRIIRLNIIILILLAIVCYFGYCLYQVDYFNLRTKVIEPTPIDKGKEEIPKAENPKDEDEKNDEDADENKDDDLEQEKQEKERMLRKYSYLVEALHIEDESVVDLYKTKILSNELKLRIAYKNLETADIKKEDNVTSFTKEAILNSAQRVLGKEVTLKDETFTYNKARFMFYNDSYVGFKEEEEKTNFMYDIVDIDIKDLNYLKFEVISALIDEDGELEDIDGNIIAKNLNDKNLDAYKDKLPHYIFTFEKDEDTYIFKSIEKKPIAEVTY